MPLYYDKLTGRTIDTKTGQTVLMPHPDQESGFSRLYPRAPGDALRQAISRARQEALDRHFYEQWLAAHSVSWTAVIDWSHALHEAWPE